MRWPIIRSRARSWTEICDQLAAVPRGEPYPALLAELRLTYPDGGDSSLLSRFEYQRTATNCTVRTVLDDKEWVGSFP